MNSVLETATKDKNPGSVQNAVASPGASGSAENVSSEPLGQTQTEKPLVTHDAAAASAEPVEVPGAQGAQCPPNAQSLDVPGTQKQKTHGSQSQGQGVSKGQNQGQPQGEAAGPAQKSKAQLRAERRALQVSQ